MLGWAAMAGGLGTAGFAAYVRTRARRHEARAEAAFPPEGQVVEVEGHEVHAVDLGPRDAPAVVLIHGSSGNTRDFTHGLAPALARDFRVLVFDRPGLGYSAEADPGGASIARQAALLSKAARQLGATRPIVLGQSYGGAVALAWGVHHADAAAALVLLAAPTQPWSSGLGWYYTLLSNPVLGPLAIPLLTAFVRDDRVARELAAIFAPQAPPPGYGAHIGAGLTLRRASLRANALQRANLLAEVRALQPLYPRIPLPVEALHGTADTTVGFHIHAEPLAAQLPSVHLTPLPGIGHMPQHVAQPQVIAAVHRAARRAGLVPALSPGAEIS
ncbi:MAG: alpha/beta hydrolase [Paracoccaceae bacterium]